MIQKIVAYTVRDDMQHTQVQYHIHYKQIILAYYGDNEPVNSTLYVGYSYLGVIVTITGFLEMITLTR